MQRLPIPGTPHPTSPKHLTDWNDSGSVLKFLGTHRRHSEGLRASASGSPPRPHQRRAQTASLEPTLRVSRKRQANGAGLALRSRPQSIPASPALTPRASKAPSVARTPQGLPCTSSFENPLIYSFHTFEPGGKPVHRPPHPPASGRPSAALRVSTFSAQCQPALLPAPNLPRDMPAPCLAGAHAAVPGGLASPAFLPPSPSFPASAWIAMGGSAGRLPPPIHLFPMTLAGLEHSGPAPAGSRTRQCAYWGEGQGPDRRPQATHFPGPPPTQRTLGHTEWGRTRIGPPPCTRLLADHKRKGKRTSEAGLGVRYWLLPAGVCWPWPQAGGALPLTLHHPPRSSGPRPLPTYFNLRTTRCLRRAASSNLYPAMAGRFTAARARGRGASIPPPGFTAWGEEGGVRREFNNWLRALKTKLKPFGGGSNPFPPGLQTAEGGQ